jgi:hypothetical protein
MNDQLHSRHTLRVHTGLVLLVLSVGLLFLFVPVTITRIIENVHDARICKEEIKYLQREYGRQREESESLNKEVIQTNQQINLLAATSNRNNETINRLMNDALTKKENRDSITLLYDEQLRIIEPQVDSLQQRFGSLTSQMISALQQLYQQEKDLNISKFKESKFTSVGMVWKISLVVGILLVLLLGILALKSIQKGFRQLKEAD